MPWGAAGYMRWVPPLTWQCTPQIESVLGRAPADARVVDLGAGGRVLGPRHIRLDFRPCPHTTVLGDAQQLPFQDASVDLLIATGLLEHVERGDLVLDEMRRVVRPGGIVHIEVPFLQQQHDDPIDCRRFTIYGLESELARRGFVTIKKGMHIGPTVTMLTLGAYYVSLWIGGRGLVSRTASAGVFLAWSAIAWPFKFLDRVLASRPGADRLAFGVYCTVRMPVEGAEQA